MGGSSFEVGCASLLAISTRTSSCVLMTTAKGVVVGVLREAGAMTGFYIASKVEQLLEFDRITGDHMEAFDPAPIFQG